VREFVQILRLHLEHPAVLVEQAIGLALEHGCPHLAGVRLCLRQLLHPDLAPPVLDLSAHPHLAEIGAQPLSLARYEQLLAGGR
jgi:hypothetical protein